MLSFLKYPLQFLRNTFRHAPNARVEGPGDEGCATPSIFNGLTEFERTLLCMAKDRGLLSSDVFREDGIARKALLLYMHRCELDATVVEAGWRTPAKLALRTGEVSTNFWRLGSAQGGLSLVLEAAGKQSALPLYQRADGKWQVSMTRLLPWLVTTYRPQYESGAFIDPGVEAPAIDAAIVSAASITPFDVRPLLVQASDDLLHAILSGEDAAVQALLGLGQSPQMQSADLGVSVSPRLQVDAEALAGWVRVHRPAVAQGN